MGVYIHTEWQWLAWTGLVHRCLYTYRVTRVSMDYASKGKCMDVYKHRVMRHTNTELWVCNGHVQHTYVLQMHSSLTITSLTLACNSYWRFVKIQHSTICLSSKWLVCCTKVGGTNRDHCDVHEVIKGWLYISSQSNFLSGLHVSSTYILLHTYVPPRLMLTLLVH